MGRSFFRSDLNFPDNWQNSIGHGVTFIGQLRLLDNTSLSAIYFLCSYADGEKVLQGGHTPKTLTAAIRRKQIQVRDSSGLCRRLRGKLAIGQAIRSYRRLYRN